MRNGRQGVSLRLDLRTFFGSTTATDFIVDSGNVLPNTKAETLISPFLSKAKISTSKAKKNQLDKHYFRTTSKLLQTVFAIISKKPVEGPVIVFTKQDEKA